MDSYNTRYIFPVILKVPDEEKTLSGRESVAFLRQYARRAVLISAEKSGMDLPQLRNDESGAPIPVGGVFWSLSHKPGYVAGVVSESPIGIDVEFIRPVSTALFNKILDEREQKLGGIPSPEFFFRCWTAKEGVLKAAGVGIRGLSRCRIDRIISPAALTVSYEKRGFEIEQTVYDDHIISVVTRGQAVRWCLPARNQELVP